MPTKVLPLLLAALVPSAAKGSVEPGAPLVREIRIEYSHGGWGSSEENYTITAGADGFHGEGGMHRKGELAGDEEEKPYKAAPIDAAAVDALVATLRAPVVDQASAIDRLVPPEWLAGHAQEQFKQRFGDWGKWCSPEAKQVFIDGFQAPMGARKAMQEYFAQRWTDDYPNARVAVTFADGSKLEARSGSQQLRMLPWKLDGLWNWNVDLAPAIARVLPRKSMLRERLAGQEEGFPQEYARSAYDEYGHRVEDLETRCRNPEKVARLEAKYEVLYTWSNYDGGISAYLRRADMPSNLRIQMVTFGPKQDREFRQFEEKMGKYIALAIPYARAHPANNVDLMFYKGSSLAIYDDYEYMVDDKETVKRLAQAPDDVAVVRDSGEKSISKYVFLLPSGEVLRPHSSTE